MSAKNSDTITISTQALERIPFYLHYLKQLQKEGIAVIASRAIATDLRLNEIQVRKDFAAISTEKGKPKSGFIVSDLIYNMEHILGYHNVNDAVIVGVGSLGKALLSYKGFDDWGLNIAAAFDTDESIIGSELSGIKVLHVNKLSSICRRLNIHMGIITVPEDHAQTVCDQLVAGGIRAIWNFAPIHLNAPEDIMVKNENMAASLAIISNFLRKDILH